MQNDRTHFAHREAAGLVVDLFWDPEDLEHEFRVEVADRISGDGFVLFPRSGRAAVRAFHHPFAVELGEERAPRVAQKAVPRFMYRNAAGIWRGSIPAASTHLTSPAGARRRPWRLAGFRL